jgi:hypothetical protein
VKISEGMGEGVSVGKVVGVSTTSIAVMVGGVGVLGAGGAIPQAGRFRRRLRGQIALSRSIFARASFGALKVSPNHN